MHLGSSVSACTQLRRQILKICCYIPCSEHVSDVIDNSIVHTFMIHTSFKLVSLKDAEVIMVGCVQLVGIYLRTPAVNAQAQLLSII